MPSRLPNRIISVIGTQLYQPIADLISKLVARPYQRPDRVSSDYYEGGYSAAIILLLAASVESLVQRDRYFYRIANPTSKPSNTVGQYSKALLGYRRHSHLEEVFEVRNSIAHNHIWEIEFDTPPDGGRQHKRSRVVSEMHRLRAVPPPLPAFLVHNVFASICNLAALIGQTLQRLSLLACISSPTCPSEVNAPFP